MQNPNWLSPKERHAGQLANKYRDFFDTFNASLKEKMDRDALAASIKVNPIVLRNIQDGSAHKLPTAVLLKVFDFFTPPEQTEDVKRLIVMVGMRGLKKAPYIAGI